MIIVDKENKIFHLRNKQISYILSVEEKGLLAHHYYGKAISNYHGGRRYPRFERSFSFNFEGDEKRIYSRDTLLQEFSSFGVGDFRIPSIEVKDETGLSISDFRYDSYNIFKGKKPLKGLPASFSNNDKVETLEICLKDEILGLKLYLTYSIFDDGAITRSSRLFNEGENNVTIETISSMSLDLPAAEWGIIHLSGAWGNERQIQRDKLTRGIHVFDSKRGTSSHQENPFFALVNKETTEYFGETYGFSLIYSGNHESAIEVDQYKQVRLTMGINPNVFSWKLKPLDSFQSPEVVMIYSDKGLNKMSQNFHRFFQKNLIRSRFKNQERPILINNWEATYFDFNQDKLIELMDAASDLGVELFVLDDGWFGKRDSDKTSLGDWYINRKKLPDGLNFLSHYAKTKGMKFGIWFEPEMMSKSSELFQKHPEWYLHVPHREAAQSRSQYVLNISRRDVKEYIISFLTEILIQNDINYVKWDMNRYLSDIASTEIEKFGHGEVSHRYVLNLYDIFERITTQFPDILFEGCSGGGGRFDPGILYYMPQIWASDNSDAIARLKIQYGTSLIYPISSMGAHVSASPNHQNGRFTSLATRGNVAMFGAFGYELDPTKLMDNEKETIKKQINYYKKYRKLFQYGTFYRNISPFESNNVSWNVVSEDKSQAIALYTTVLSEAAPELKILKVSGLDSHADYYCFETGETYSGDELEQVGFYLNPIFNREDFESRLFTFEKVNSR